MDLDKRLKKLEQAFKRYDERVTAAFGEYDRKIREIHEALRMKKLGKVRAKILQNGK